MVQMHFVAPHNFLLLAVSKGKGRRARGQRRAADKVKGRGLVLTDDLIMQYK